MCRSITYRAIKEYGRKQGKLIVLNLTKQMMTIYVELSTGVTLAHSSKTIFLIFYAICFIASPRSGGNGEPTHEARLRCLENPRNKRESITSGLRLVIRNEINKFSPENSLIRVVNPFSSSINNFLERI
jgi:hypothetical protein